MGQIQPPISDKTSRIGYVALGSNLSTATRTSQQVVTEALRLFSGESLRIIQQSQWYSAPAFPKGNGPDYVNGVVEIETSLGAAETIAALHRIEAKLGRARTTRWASRVVDLDLLALGGIIAPSVEEYTRWQTLQLDAQMTETPEGLVLPHPRLQDRAFVLIPLAEIAPDWRHPVLGQTASTLLAALSSAERDEILPL